MHTIREVLRLHHEAGLSYAQIEGALGISKGAISRYLHLSQAQGLGWPLPEGLSDAALERRLFPRPASKGERAEPDYAAIHQELKRKGMTLQLLWSEYATLHGARAYRYSRFCDRYRDWAQRQKRSLRQIHTAGEKLFIDYCGPTVAVVEGTTGVVRAAQIFVAVLGASSYTYAEATWTQQLPDWIGAHQRALRFFGGVPALLVPDNLKSAVQQGCRYDPVPNATYQDMAQHYGTAILPARPYKPQDKAKAEVGVQVVERWILARLRHHTFFSLQDLNQAIAELLQALNARPFQKLPGSRRTLFEQLDQPALKPLPRAPYDFAEWKHAKPGIDYHIEVAKHYYSVPHALVGQRLDVRISATLVEVFCQGRSVARHARATQGGFTTLPEHMPPAHRAHRQWSPARFLHWASTIGPATLAVVTRQLHDRPHPEHGYRACLGILHLAKHYTPARLEAACERALQRGAPYYGRIHALLKQGFEPLPAEPEPNAPSTLPHHDNVRGPEYYH